MRMKFKGKIHSCWKLRFQKMGLMGFFVLRSLTQCEDIVWWVEEWLLLVEDCKVYHWWRNTNLVIGRRHQWTWIPSLTNVCGSEDKACEMEEWLWLWSMEDCGVCYRWKSAKLVVSGWVQSLPSTKRGDEKRLIEHIRWNVLRFLYLILFCSYFF